MNIIEEIEQVQHAKIIDFIAAINSLLQLEIIRENPNHNKIKHLLAVQAYHLNYCNYRDKIRKNNG
jgi:hypothetical protein